MQQSQIERRNWWIILLYKYRDNNVEWSLRSISPSLWWSKPLPAFNARLSMNIFECLASIPVDLTCSIKPSKSKMILIQFQLLPFYVLWISLIPNFIHHPFLEKMNLLNFVSFRKAYARNISIQCDKNQQKPTNTHIEEQFECCSKPATNTDGRINGIMTHLYYLLRLCFGRLFTSAFHYFLVLFFVFVLWFFLLSHSLFLSCER